MNTDQLLKRTEAADLCGVEVSTVKRAIAGGRLPNARRDSGPNGPWRIPVSDLVDAGMYRPGTEDDPAVDLRSTRAEREMAVLRVQLAKLEATCQMRERELAHRDDEVRYSRKLLDKLASRGEAA